MANHQDVMILTVFAKQEQTHPSVDTPGRRK